MRSIKSLEAFKIDTGKNENVLYELFEFFENDDIKLSPRFAIIGPNYLEKIFYYLAYIHDFLKDYSKRPMKFLIVLNKNDFHSASFVFKNIIKRLEDTQGSLIKFLKSNNEIKSTIDFIERADDMSVNSKMIFFTHTDIISSRFDYMPCEVSKKNDVSDDMMKLVEFCEIYFLNHNASDILSLIDEKKRVYFIMNNNTVLFKKNVITDICEIGHYLDIGFLKDKNYIYQYGVKNVIDDVIHPKILITSTPQKHVSFNPIKVSSDMVAFWHTLNKLFFKDVLKKLNDGTDIRFIDESRIIGNINAPKHKMSSRRLKRVITVLNDMIEFMKAYEVFWFDVMESMDMLSKLCLTNIKYQTFVKNVPPQIKIPTYKHGRKTVQIIQILRNVYKNSKKHAGVSFIVVPDFMKFDKLMSHIVDLESNITKQDQTYKEFVMFATSSLFVNIQEMHKVLKAHDKNCQLIILNQSSFEDLVTSSNLFVRSMLCALFIFSQKYVYSPLHQHDLVNLFPRNKTPKINVYFGDTIIEVMQATYIYKRKCVINQEMNLRPYTWQKNMAAEIPLIKFVMIPYFENPVTTGSYYDTKDLTPLELLKTISHSAYYKSDYIYMRPSVEDGVDIKLDESDLSKIGTMPETIKGLTITLNDDDLLFLSMLLIELDSRVEFEQLVKSIDILLTKYFEINKVKYQDCSTVKKKAIKNIVYVLYTSTSQKCTVCDIVNELYQDLDLTKQVKVNPLLKEEIDYDLLRSRMRRFFLNIEVIIWLTFSTDTHNNIVMMKLFGEYLDLWMEAYGSIDMYYEICGLVKKVNKRRVIEISSQKVVYF